MTAPTPAALLGRMVEEVFNEPDAERRAAVVAEVFAEDVVFTDPGAVVTGRVALEAAITGLLAQGPGFVFSPAGPFRGVGGLGSRPWRLGPPGGDPVLAGLDVVEVVDGRIARLWTMLDG
ncbi:hypothetical protein GCM10022197_08760 [Microlunatus spumicola]|uniref:SnoaL-like domain-containing protein n=1 Tax=Microlunatus spumicola TaxID=81499 RepID=A0ABP6WS05_9ACTN